MSQYDAKGKFIGGKCDMSKCSEMSKAECAAMCDSKGCSAEEKKMCMSQYDAKRKFIGGH